MTEGQTEFPGMPAPAETWFRITATRESTAIYYVQAPDQGEADAIAEALLDEIDFGDWDDEITTWADYKTFTAVPPGEEFWNDSEEAAYWDRKARPA